MKRIKNLFTAILILSIVVISCGILDENNRTEATTDLLFSTPEGFDSAVNAAYSFLRSYYGQELGGNMTEMGTDIIMNGEQGSNQFMNLYNAELNSEAGNFWNTWSNFYQAINTTNAVINRAPEIDISGDLRNTRVAEARFLRAHYYFLLVEHFGDVPLTLDETVGVEIESERTPENLVYESIISDLDFAIANLPDVQEQFGRATRPAAQHMLSRVLLTRGYKDFAASDDFSRAATLADQVIDNPNHRLLDTPAEVFDFDNQENEEVVWSVQYSKDILANNPGNWSHVGFRPWYEIFNDGLVRSLEPGYGRPWIRYRPTQFGMENYRPLDVDSRYESWFQYVWLYNSEEGIPEGAAVGDTAIWVTDMELNQQIVDEIEGRLPGVFLITWNKNNKNDPWYWPVNMYPNLKKVDDFERRSINDINGSRDFIVYRLAETYLNAAEALLMDGRPDEAVEYVNAVRRRAAWPGKESEMEITAAELDLDFLLDERGREFYGEYNRWLDLKRTRKLVERVRLYDDTAGADNIQDFHQLRPIPANQINRTTSDFPQNPGF